MRSRGMRLPRFVSAAALWVLVAVVWMFPPSAQAFCPTNGFKCSLGAVGVTHEDMTKQAVQELHAEFFGSTRQTHSMKQALEEIARANAEVDEDQVNGFKHFDGESFAAGKERLITLTGALKNQLAAGDGQGARRSLGQALHSIQDFYSHSTFIESGRSGALTSLWNPGQALPDMAGPDAPTCKAPGPSPPTPAVNTRSTCSVRARWTWTASASSRRAGARDTRDSSVSRAPRSSTFPPPSARTCLAGLAPRASS